MVRGRKGALRTLFPHVYGPLRHTLVHAMMLKRVCCDSCDFFFAVSHVSLSHAYTAKKKLHDVTIFLLHAFTAKKKLHNLPQKNITRCDDFFLHTFAAKIKKLHDLTAKKELPILLKMHACRQCAHLWATSDFSPALGVGDPRECRGDVALLPSFGPRKGRDGHFWFCPPLQGSP